MLTIEYDYVLFYMGYKEGKMYNGAFNIKTNTRISKMEDLYNINTYLKQQLKIEEISPTGFQLLSRKIKLGWEARITHK